MISVVISSYRPQMYKRLADNIHETAGCICELIQVENDNRYSISEAYNLGASRSKYPYLCFVHEDVLFQTDNWGQSLIAVMEKDPSIGLLGVAGCKARPGYESNWYKGMNFNAGHIRQGQNSWENFTELRFSPRKKDLEEVVWIDGVFMFTRSALLNTCRFDQDLLKGFHGYDVDFSLQVFASKWKIMVYEGLDLYHYSPGNHDEKFDESVRLITRKWKHLLPATTPEVYPGKWQLLKWQLSYLLRYDQRWFFKALRKMKGA